MVDTETIRSDIEDPSLDDAGGPSLDDDKTVITKHTLFVFATVKRFKKYVPSNDRANEGYNALYKRINEAEERNKNMAGEPAHKVIVISDDDE
ncbi:hypothetical protein GGF41_002651 [Coemansia sp. RSA 2531]|nr:hypothetical protein GGF41_002651 [Coemansia sp. RSA 2531]